jgi:hypothetical protein
MSKIKKTCKGRSLAQFEANVLSTKETQSVKGGSANYTGGSEIIVSQ